MKYNVALYTVTHEEYIYIDSDHVHMNLDTFEDYIKTLSWVKTTTDENLNMSQVVKFVVRKIL